VGFAGGSGPPSFPPPPPATALLGDAIGANLFLLGYALQLGAVPVGLPALERAIELNGRAVELNKRALAWGRMAAHDLAAVEQTAAPLVRESDSRRAEKPEEIVAIREEFLTRYQNAAYARRYRDLVERVAARERELSSDGAPLTQAVARYYFKLLAYKDEYEVARLYTDGSFRKQIEQTFEGDYRIKLHLAPQMLFPVDRDTGRVRKVTVGPWIFPLLRGLARLKVLRGTPLDVFGWTAHRRAERRLIAEYERTVAELIDALSPDNRDLAVEIASIPELIRGFGTVKDEHLASARAKQTELVEAFRLRSPLP
jgi:indolepyruvate ferredoxin oxidoreductase